MKLQLFILVTFCVIFTSCDSKPANIFEAPEIGWSFPIPRDVEIIDKREITENIKAGEAYINKNLDESFELGGDETSLITLQRNEFTKLQATIIPFKETYDDEWNDKYPEVKGFVYDIFKSQGVAVDSSSTTEMISNVRFEVFQLKIRNGSSLIMVQDMYRAYINGYDVIFNITGDNVTNKTNLLNAFKKSTFEN